MYTQYITLAELQTRFDNQYTFGTGTSCFASEGFGTFMLSSVSAEFDCKMEIYYGTFNPIFGTNSLGTLDVPEEVKSCVADLAMAQCLQKKQLGQSEREQKWIAAIEKSGNDKLAQLLDPTNNLAPFAGTKICTTIETPGAYEWIKGELRNFNGTAIVPLLNKYVIKDSVKIYGTNFINPTIYVQDVDFKVWGYNTDYQGTLMGCIAGIGTVGSLSSFPVYVDYKFQKPSMFTINDNIKWGMMKKEWRG